MAHSISLSWQPSVDAVDGYNLYRGSAGPGSEGTTPINGTTLITVTNYTDSTVTEGVNYSYYATSVKSGVQSLHSNEVVQELLPAPPTSLVVVAVA